MAALRKLRDWLTIEETAEELTGPLSEQVLPSDVLRLEIDGDLRMLLYLPVAGDGAMQTT